MSSLDDRINSARTPQLKARRMRARGDSIDDIAEALSVDYWQVVEWLEPRPTSRPKPQLVAGILHSLR
jgi:hypothetical protein